MNSPVEEIFYENGRVPGVRIGGDEYEADAVVVAADAPAVARLTDEAVPRESVGQTCIYYATDGLNHEKKILLNADDGGFLNNAVQISNISPSYAPGGQELVCAVALGDLDLPDAELYRRGVAEISGWYPHADLPSTCHLPHPVRPIRPAAGHARAVARKPDGNSGARDRRRVHPRLLDKRLHALGREGRAGGARLVNAERNGHHVPALRVENLRKTYKNGLVALDGVSLDIEPGSFFGLLGPNGAGKTTLINSIVSLVRPDSGKVEVFGKDAYEEFKEARAMIGVLSPGDKPGQVPDRAGDDALPRRLLRRPEEESPRTLRRAAGAVPTSSASASSG